MTEQHLDNSPSAEEIVDTVLNACADAKGKDITVLDVQSVFGMASYFVLVTARSDRQAQGICNKVLDALADHHVTPLSVDGLETGHWVLADLGEVMVHIFYEPIREYYDLEGLWSTARRVPLPIELEKAAA